MASIKFSAFHIAYLVHEWDEWKYSANCKRLDDKSNYCKLMKTYKKHFLPRGRSYEHIKDNFTHARGILRAGIRGLLVNRTIPLRVVKKRAAAIQGLNKTKLSNDCIRYILSFL